MSISKALVLILSLSFGPGKDRAGGVLAYVSPTPSSKASSRHRGGKVSGHGRESALTESLDSDNFDGFQQVEDVARTSTSLSAENNPYPTTTTPRSNVEHVSKVVASAAIDDDAARLRKEVEASAKELKAQQEQLERLRAQRDEILKEFGPPVAAAWLTPLAALGAGRAYLQRREAVQTEVENAKVELEAKRAVLEQKEQQLGRAVSLGSGSQRRSADGKSKRNKLNVSPSMVCDDVGLNFARIPGFLCLSHSCSKPTRRVCKTKQIISGTSF